MDFKPVTTEASIKGEKGIDHALTKKYRYRRDPGSHIRANGKKGGRKRKARAAKGKKERGGTHSTNTCTVRGCQAAESKNEEIDHLPFEERGQRTGESLSKGTLKSG